MSSYFVQSKNGVTLVGGGEVTLPDLVEALSLAPGLVAADGGANFLVESGYCPDAVIGDFDSVGADALAGIPLERHHIVTEQDSTDFEKSLRSIKAGFVLALGFSGARIDHGLAVWSVLARRTDSRCIVVGRHDVAFLSPERLSLPVAPGTRVSLFPMGAVHGQSTGLRWPIDGIAFAPDGRIGTSNEATGPVDLCFSTRSMLVLLPRDCLRLAIGSLVPEG